MAKKTITLEGFGGPTHVLCVGHVDAKTFNEAYGEEWSGKGTYKQADLQYQYWVRLPPKNKKKASFSMKQVVPGTPGAKKYTVAKWD